MRLLVCIGLASQQSAQYSAVDELRTTSTGALFLRSRLLVDPCRIPDRGCVFLKLLILFIRNTLNIGGYIQFFAKNGLVAKIAKLNTR